jgi:hypothetical protein
VQFYDFATPLGSPVTVASGVAALVLTTPAPTISVVTAQTALTTFGIAGGSLAYASGNTAGNILVVLCYASQNLGYYSGNPGAVFTVSDTQGNIYQQVDGVPWSYFSGNFANINTAVFVAYNVNAGANTVLMGVTGLASGATGVVVTEYVGGANVNPLVGYSIYANTAGSSPFTSSVALTTTQPNQAVLLWIVDLPGAGYPPAGFTGVTGFATGIVATPGVNTYTFGSSLTPAGSQMIFGLVLTNVLQSALPPGTHDLTAQYTPSEPIFAGNTSNTVIEVIS